MYVNVVDNTLSKQRLNFAIFRIEFLTNQVRKNLIIIFFFCFNIFYIEVNASKNKTLLFLAVYYLLNW